MSWRPSPPAVGAVGILLVIGLVAGGWVLWTSRAMSAVEVGWRGEPDCSGATLERDGHTIKAQDGMSCVITVEVRNTGGRTVHLDRAVLPFLGPGGGAVVRAGEIDGRDPAPAVAANDIDARIDLDHDLEGGETWTFRTLVVFRKNGCTSAGTGSFYGWPVVEIATLGRHGTATSSQELTYSRERQNPGCRMNKRR